MAETQRNKAHKDDQDHQNDHDIAFLHLQSPRNKYSRV
jgi:hypothetical protein